MIQQNPYSKYQELNALTASPGELTLLLYDGCVKALRRGTLFINEQKHEDAHNEMLRAQAILTELQTTLDMQYEVSQGLYAIYDFMHTSVAQANMKKDATALPDIITMLSVIRDAWQQAVRDNRRQVLTEQEA